MKTKHTPGPWTVDHEVELVGRDECVRLEIGNAVRHIATIHEHVDDEGLATDEANAQLIAAAPALLSALTAIRATLKLIEVKKGSDLYVATIEGVIAMAIENATGERK